MTPATKLIRMAYELLTPMHNLKTTELISQSTMPMLDGSRLTYNISITMQTENDDKSHAYQNIRYQSIDNFMKPIEQLAAQMLCKYDPDDEPKPHDGDNLELLTADDYPECAA